MKNIFMSALACTLMAGCASSLQPTSKPWHLSPTTDTRSSEFYVVIPFSTARAIKPGMTEDQLKVLVGGVIMTATTMPSFPFFVAQRNDGVLFEVAVMMNAERRIQDVSFKKREMPTHRTVFVNPRTGCQNRQCERSPKR